jgi:phosphate starvation-inducible protein PhoH
MQLYRIYDADLDETNRRVSWRGTMADAQYVMKGTEDQFRPCIQIDLVEVKNDKPNFLAALSGEDLPDAPVVLKSWRGTTRGGVKEMGGEG